MTELTEERIREIVREELAKYMQEYMPPKVRMNFFPPASLAKTKVKNK